MVALRTSNILPILVIYDDDVWAPCYEGGCKFKKKDDRKEKGYRLFEGGILFRAGPGLPGRNSQ
jgi:hypothetical protein